MAKVAGRSVIVREPVSDTAHSADCPRRPGLGLEHRLVLHLAAPVLIGMLGTWVKTLAKEVRIPACKALASSASCFLNGQHEVSKGIGLHLACQVKRADAAVGTAPAHLDPARAAQRSLRRRHTIPAAGHRASRPGSTRPVTWCRRWRTGCSPQLIPALYLDRMAAHSPQDETRHRLAALSAQGLKPLRHPTHPLRGPSAWLWSMVWKTITPCAMLGS